jgi:hypothetical protein
MSEDVSGSDEPHASVHTRDISRYTGVSRDPSHGIVTFSEVSWQITQDVLRRSGLDLSDHALW